MIIVRRFLGLGLGGAAVIVLAGCGGAAQPSTGAAPSQAPSSSVPSVASSAPATEAPSTQTSKSSGDDSDAAKPSKSEIVAGLTKFYESKQGLPKTKAEKFATCMVDQMYDKAKTASLIAMRDGDPSKLDASDAGLLAESGMNCSSALK